MICAEQRLSKASKQANKKDGCVTAFVFAKHTLSQLKLLETLKVISVTISFSKSVFFLLALSNGTHCIQ